MNIEKKENTMKIKNQNNDNHKNINSNSNKNNDINNIKNANNKKEIDINNQKKVYEDFKDKEIEVNIEKITKDDLKLEKEEKDEITDITHEQELENFDLKKAKEKQKKEKSFLEMFLSDMKWCVIVLIILFFIFNFILSNGVVPSGSMEKTIMPGNFIITNKLAYINSEPKKGDIIVFKTDDMETAYVKRVIGTENDVIDIKNNKVYLNNQELDESEYSIGKTMIGNNARSHFIVPKDCVFLLGDNRENSSDSRFWTEPFINNKDVIGEVLFEYSVGLNGNGIFFKTIESNDLKILE